MVNYKVWCDQCQTWTDDFMEVPNAYAYEHITRAPITWICCMDCGNGLIMVTK